MTTDPDCWACAKTARIVEIATSCVLGLSELFEDIAKARPGRPNTAVPIDTGHLEGFFHRGRLEEARPEIEAFVTELVPDILFEGRGGGAPVGHLLLNREGVQWAPPKVGDLFLAVLMALKIARFSVENRELWPRLFPDSGPFLVLRHPSDRVEVKHLLVEGAALCGIPGPPGKWPEGHLWTSERGVVSCVGCLLVFPLLGSAERGST